jgi:hypothetical protein
MSDSDPDVPVQAPISVYSVVLVGWQQLAKSRDSIIRELYLRLALAKGITLDNTMSAREARRHCLENGTFVVKPTSVELDAFESRAVFISRLCALWLLLWTSILPFAAAASWAAFRLFSVSRHNVVFITSTAGGAVVVYFAVAFVGLLAQTLFARPFAAFVNWLVRPIKLDI